jgi:glutaminyl-peptide cyclotransferase
MTGTARMRRIHRLGIAWLTCASAACGRAQAPPPAFDAANVLVHVERQCALGPRVPGTAARDSAAAYIARSAAACGAKVTAQTISLDDPYGTGRLRLVNLVASFAVERKKRVMLAAHYDTRPFADQETVDSLRARAVPGAVDAAASVGILLEIARMLGERMPEHIGVDLVFFDGEDYGKTQDLAHYLLGSKHFAGHLEGYRPECAILLDMVGGVGTRVAREGYSARQASTLLDDLFARARALDLDYFVDVTAGPVYDDHVPLLQAGIHAVDLFGYEYAHWHTTRDTPDKVDPALVAQVGALLRDFLYRYGR